MTKISGLRSQHFSTKINDLNPGKLKKKKNVGVILDLTATNLALLQYFWAGMALLISWQVQNGHYI